MFLYNLMDYCGNLSVWFCFLHAADYPLEDWISIYNNNIPEMGVCLSIALSKFVSEQNGPETCNYYQQLTENLLESTTNADL